MIWNELSHHTHYKIVQANQQQGRKQMTKNLGYVLFGRYHFFFPKLDVPVWCQVGWQANRRDANFGRCSLQLSQRVLSCCLRAEFFCSIKCFVCRQLCLHPPAVGDLFRRRPFYVVCVLPTNVLLNLEFVFRYCRLALLLIATRCCCSLSLNVVELLSAVTLSCVWLVRATTPRPLVVNHVRFCS